MSKSTERKDRLDKNEDLKYVADSFHISVVIKSGMVTFLTTSLINSYMNPGKYKAILIPLVASLASYEMWYYFQDTEEQLISAINSNNYPKVDAIIKYRIPQDKIADVIDILSQNIKWREMKEWHCNSAIETAVKLVDRAIDTESRNKSIKFAVSLALSVGEGSKLSDDVLNKIEGYKAFSEIINIAKDYLNADKCIAKGYPNDNEYYLKIKNGAINFLLRISDKIPKELIPKLIEILLPIGEANKVSDEVLNKIEGSKAFSEIIDKISSVIRIDSSEKTIYSAIDLVYRLSKINEWSYEVSNENGGNALNNIVQYLLKLDELVLDYPEQTKKLHCYINNMLSKCRTSDCKIKIVEKLLDSGQLKIISDTSISNIGKGIAAADTFKTLKDYNYKSSWYDIDEFASKLLSSCGNKCIGHAMELFYKNGDFKNQIEPFKSKFHIAEIVNELLTNMYVHTNAAEITPLEEKIFKHLVYDVEATKQIKIPLDTDCINKVQDKFHKAFHGEIYPNSNFLGDLAQDIEHCYDVSTEALKYIDTTI